MLVRAAVTIGRTAGGTCLSFSETLAGLSVPIDHQFTRSIRIPRRSRPSLLNFCEAAR
jgi:hypothetical protein